MIVFVDSVPSVSSVEFVCLNSLVGLGWFNSFNGLVVLMSTVANADAVNAHENDDAHGTDSGAAHAAADATDKWFCRLCCVI